MAGTLPKTGAVRAGGRPENPKGLTLGMPIFHVFLHFHRRAGSGGEK